MDDIVSYRARIGGFHVTAAKLSNLKLFFITNAKSIYSFICLALYGAQGLSLAILLFFSMSYVQNDYFHISNIYSDHTTPTSQSSKVHYLTILTCLTLCLYDIESILLMLSNDIEQNPGPRQVNSLENMSVIHHNIKSLRNKVDLLTVEAIHHDIIMLSETWLSSNIPNEGLLLPNFFPPLRRDREDAYGGVAIYVRNNMYFKDRPDLSVDGLEAVWAETRQGQDVLLIGCFYRPPSSLVSYWNLVDESIRKAMATPHKFIIMGDLNSDYINNPNDNKHLARIIKQNNLIQPVTELTRITASSSSCIDMILTPCRNLIEKVEILPELRSDHKIVCAKLRTKTKRNSTYKRTIVNYSKLNGNRLIEELGKINFINIANNNSLDISAELFSKKLFDTVKLCVPVRTITMRDNSAPWINEYILYLREDKKRIHLVAKRVDTPEQWAIFRHVRNFYIQEIRTQKLDYLSNLDDQISNTEKFGSKNWWKLVNNFLKNKDMNNDDIPPLTDPDDNSNTFYEHVDKANCFNRYFEKQSKILNANDPLPPIQQSNEIMPPFLLSITEVENTLKNLDTSKAVGPDLIHNKVLKMASPAISNALTLMFNRSLSESRFPDCWKKAYVTPIHKKESKSVCGNYRPISLLSCVGKVLEKCIQKRIFRFLEDNHIINPCQSGFVPGDSTVYQLLSIYDDFCKSLDNHISTQAIFFDISKAFDRVWHQGLLHKLQAIGIQGALHNWFTDYLKDRSQAVVIKGHKSNFINITAGVPQGSVLGPLLFLIYINDLTYNIDSTIKLFADDTSMYLSLNDNRIRTQTLNSDLSKIHTWATTWKVTFNALKTDKLDICNQNVILLNSLYFDNTLLNTSEYHKHLGIILQNDCKWEQHITNLIKKCRTQINCLRSYKYRLNRKSLETMFKSYILPILDYADVIWDNCTETQANALEEIQLDALRTITGSVRGTSHALLYNETGFIPLKERRKRHKLLLYFKFMNGLVPNHLAIRFPPLVSDVNPYHRRRPLNRQPPQFRTELYRKSFFPSSTDLWNNLPENIQNSKSFGEFKKYLRRDDISVPPYFYLGNRNEQIIHCKMRLGMSDLQDDLFNRHLSDRKNCECGATKETALHYLLHCPQHTHIRHTTIFNLPPIARQIRILLNGSSTYSQAFNNFIFSLVHEFIEETNRFA